MFDDLEDLTVDKKIKPCDNSSKDDIPSSGKPKQGSEPMFEVVEGIVNFSNITKHDVYNGQDTGQFSITLTMSEDDANTMSSRGIKIKDYQGAKQRKFRSRFDIKAFDGDGNQWSGEVPYNSKVRVKYKVGNEHPVHGVATYLEAVKVLEVADAVESPDMAEF